ncbi:MAG: MFS transporter [Rhodocyclaceae bacterium]|nr:MFS transporter [Rhodocyclaceae bacterium]
MAVSAPALLSAACAPLDRRFALGIWSGYLPAGVGLVMLLAPLVVPAGGWRGLWLLTLAAILLAAVAVYRLRPRLPPAAAFQRRAPSLRHGQALSQPEPWLLAIAMATWTLQHYAP